MVEMRYVVFDLEATCWKEPRPRELMEIIEIGAVMLASAAGPQVAEFARFVRPVAEPLLSAFCKELTSIRQEQVDAADAFPAVFRDFVAWAGGGEFDLCSWGAYDVRQMRQDCRRHAVPFPDGFDRHINLKDEFARLFNVKRCGMAAALRYAGLPLLGTHHRGIDDARNISRLATIILPRLEAEASAV
jgi:inhibitor of KinA sporulation pathway (predicted exonuclease)